MPQTLEVLKKIIGKSFALKSGVQVKVEKGRDIIEED